MIANKTVDHFNYYQKCYGKCLERFEYANGPYISLCLKDCFQSFKKIYKNAYIVEASFDESLILSATNQKESRGSFMINECMIG